MLGRGARNWWRSRVTKPIIAWDHDEPHLPPSPLACVERRMDIIFSGFVRGTCPLSGPGARVPREVSHARPHFARTTRALFSGRDVPRSAQSMVQHGSSWALGLVVRALVSAFEAEYAVRGKHMKVDSAS